MNTVNPAQVLCSEEGNWFVASGGLVEPLEGTEADCKRIAAALNAQQGAVNVLSADVLRPAPCGWITFRDDVACGAFLAEESAKAFCAGDARFSYIPVYASEPSRAAQAGVVEATEDTIEEAYWEFDARKRGYGKRCFAGPQSERDAFKWAVRAALAAVKGVES